MKTHNITGAVKANLHNVQHALNDGKTCYFAVFGDDGKIRSAHVTLDKRMAKALYHDNTVEEGFNVSLQYVDNVPINARLLKQFLTTVKGAAGIGENEVFVQFEYNHFELSELLKEGGL